MYKIVICGGRNFDDYELLQKYVDQELPANIEVEIVSGGAKGADRLGERYAHENHISLKIMRANWDAYGKRAGFLRNTDMAKYCDAVLAFWDGKSVGTEHMIKEAKKLRRKVTVVNYVDNQNKSSDWTC